MFSKLVKLGIVAAAGTALVYHFILDDEGKKQFCKSFHKGLDCLRSNAEDLLSEGKDKAQSVANTASREGEKIRSEISKNWDNLGYGDK